MARGPLDQGRHFRQDLDCLVLSGPDESPSAAPPEFGHLFQRMRQQKKPRKQKRQMKKQQKRPRKQKRQMKKQQKRPPQEVMKAKTQ